jgi:hypothetical protein
MCPTEMKKASSDASSLPANNILLQQCAVSDLERCLASSAADDDACQRRCLRDDDGEKKKSESLCQTIIM